jgi:hypothetical protein
MYKMIDLAQLKEFVITPALNDIQMYSDDALELLVFTAAVESDLGTYLKQINGPALGIYQMEPKTHDDIWFNYLRYQQHITHRMALKFGIPVVPEADRLIWDLRYATIMARLLYSRNPEKLPSKDDPQALYEYYKTYYNTKSGKATEAASLKKYKKFTQKASSQKETAATAQD